MRTQTAIITGSADGIGLAIARRLAKDGVNIVLSDIRQDKLQESAQAFEEQGYSVRHFVADASNEDALAKLVDYTVAEFGEVTILVNNAGKQHVAPIDSFPTEKFQDMIQLMLVGPFMATKLVVPHMKQQNYGRIINIASVNGLIGFADKAAYNSAKHGVIGLTKVAALELATFGITVNALCPGYVDTALVRAQLEDLGRSRGVSLDRVLEQVIYPLVPQRRLLQPEEIADYAAFLASETSGGITGQAVVIDGGYVAQ